MLYGRSHFRREDSLLRCARGALDFPEESEPSRAEQGALHAHNTRALTGNGPTRAQLVVQQAHSPLKPALKKSRDQPESDSD